ncbi:MAG: glycosyltransferase family 2 protein [Candidatus Heimdallarchaeota archaeon]|nr:glycosyltransferase family 2 protein [Candidatus Heimdallarchaeota archaeon]
MIKRIRDDEIAILMPALNEELNIVKTLSEIPLENSKVIVIDNGSDDLTNSLAKSAGAIVLYERRRGYGFACLAGMKYLQHLDPSPKVVVFLDADGADDPKGIIKLLNTKLNPPYPTMVMGSRLDNLVASAMSAHALIANKVLIKIINLLYRAKLKDMGPFRIIDYQTLIKLGMADTGYGWSSEMIVKTLKMGYTIKETSVIYRPRLGKSKISGSVVNSLKAAIWLTIHIFKHAFRRH